MATAIDHRAKYRGLWFRRDPQANPADILIQVVPQVRQYVAGAVRHEKIAVFTAPHVRLGLYIQLRRDRGLHKEIADIVPYIVVPAESVRLVMELPGADGDVVIDPGNDGLIAAKYSRLPTRPETLSCAWLRSNSGVNSLNPGRAGPPLVMMFEVGLAQARLHRVDVDVLQELRLQAAR